MHYTITYVTPEMAKAWLEKNLDSNRSIKQSVVDKYSRDMKEGNWKLTHEAIAFDTKGRLIDGQHRLWAVLLSGATVQMLVANGVPDDAFDHIDQGIPRTAMDVFKTQGKNWVTKDDLAITRMLEHGHVAKNIISSPYELGLAVEKHKEALTFVSTHMKNFRRVPAPVKTAVAAAWYYEDDKDELIRFIAVLNSGITQYNKDRVVIILRDFMRQGTKGGAKIRSIQYLKAARAIKAFMSDEDLHKLYAVEPTPYPIPIQIVEPKHEESTPEVTRHARRSRTKKIENVMQVTIQ